MIKIGNTTVYWGGGGSSVTADWIFEITEVTQDGNLLFESQWQSDIIVYFKGHEYLGEGLGGVEAIVPVTVNDVGEIISVAATDGYRQWFNSDSVNGLCSNQSNDGRIHVKLQACPKFNRMTYDRNGTQLPNHFMSNVLYYYYRDIGTLAVYDIAPEVLKTLTNTETVTELSYTGCYTYVSLCSLVYLDNCPLPDGAFNFDNVTRMDRQFGVTGGSSSDSFIFLGAGLRLLPEGSFSFKNLTSAYNQSFYLFTGAYGMGLTTLPQGSFSFDKLNTFVSGGVDNFLNQFNYGGLLGNYGSGPKVQIRNKQKARLWYWRDANGNEQSATVANGGYLTYNANP